MAKAKHLGEFEIMLLAALMRLGDQAYGVSVRQEIERRGGRSVSIGAVYTTLSRLERKGYVKSSLGAPSAVRGGRAKRFFRVTTAGADALKKAMATLNRMVEGLAIEGSTC